MPWLGDGTWVNDYRLARDIVRGKTNYVPWSGDLTTATPRDLPITGKNPDEDSETDAEDAL